VYGNLGAKQVRKMTNDVCVKPSKQTGNENVALGKRIQTNNRENRHLSGKKIKRHIPEARKCLQGNKGKIGLCFWG